MTTSRHPAAWIPLLSSLTTDDIKEMAADARTCVLVRLGCVDPHGPHLPISIDTTISEVACIKAARRLVENNIDVYIAPSVPYGVTDFAEGFPGAIGVPAEALTALLGSIVERLLRDGWTHVCLVNNHLEPAQDGAVRAGAEKEPKGGAPVA